jgi:hypothetical protein
MRAAVTFARESEITMSSNEPKAFRRPTSRGAQILNWVAFAILFLFIGMAIIK